MPHLVRAHPCHPTTCCHPIQERVVYQHSGFLHSHKRDHSVRHFTANFWMVCSICYAVGCAVCKTWCFTVCSTDNRLGWLLVPSSFWRRYCKYRTFGRYFMLFVCMAHASGEGICDGLAATSSMLPFLYQVSSFLFRPLLLITSRIINLQNTPLRTTYSSRCPFSEMAHFFIFLIFHHCIPSFVSSIFSCFSVLQYIHCNFGCGICNGCVTLERMRASVVGSNNTENR